MTGRWRQHLIRSNTERSALNRCRMNAMGLVARSKERMKGRSQGGWQLQHSLLNPCIEGKAPSSSPAGPVQRPSRLSCPWGDTAGTAQPWGECPSSRGCSSPPQSPSMTQLAQPPRAHSYRRAGSCQIPAPPREGHETLQKSLELRWLWRTGAQLAQGWVCSAGLQPQTNLGNLKTPPWLKD